jgi:hypothetical protein
MRKFLKWGVPLIAAALAVTTLLPASSAAARTTSTLYKLELISLMCNNQQDTIGPDTVDLYINGAFVDGPRKFHRGDSHTFTNTSALFTGVATIEAVEEDGISNDDALGSVTVSQNASGGGIQTGYFDALNHAKYTILYEVTPN